MKKILLLSIAGMFLASTAYADFDIGTWRYKKAITGLPEVPAVGFVKVNLDREASMNAKTDLSDIRVIANSSTETAFQMVVENESVRTEYRPSTLSDLSSKGGETMFVLDLAGEGVLHDNLSIISGSKNFKRAVAVYAADTHLPMSDAKWRLLTDKGNIYNFYDEVSGFNAGSGEVSYPPNTSRYLKVVIKKGEGTDVAVTDAHVLRLSRQYAKENQLQMNASVAHNLVHKTSEIVLDLGGGGIPTHRITLATGDTKNFSRRAVIEESSDAKTWSAIGDGYVFSLVTPLFSGQELSIPYRESQSRYLRVIIMDEDDMPVTWNEKVRIDGVVRAVVFQPTAGNVYALYYGNARAHAPQYDLARYFQYVESTGLSHAMLAAQEENQGFLAPAAPKVALSDRQPNILNGVLVLLVAVVTFLLISYLKKLKHTPRG